MVNQELEEFSSFFIAGGHGHEREDKELDELRDNRGFNFTIIGNRLIEDTTLNAYDKTTYIVLCKFVSMRDRSCFPSLKVLCELVGASKHTVLKSLETLQAHGYIQKYYRLAKSNKKEKTSNLYVLTGLDMEQGSAPDAPQVVHDVHHGSAPDAPQVVHDVHSNYNQLNNNHLTNKRTRKKSSEGKPKTKPDKYEGFYL